MVTRIVGVLLLISSIAPLWALEIDEKLTLRVLSISTSKKTILINRGLEDGLVVGDHAKFFLTTGVIARGVVIKASPGRSIWSLYRLVDPEQISQDKVMNLKASSALKLTEDPTRTLTPTVIPEGSETLVAKGDPSGDMNDLDRQELEAMKSTPTASAPPVVAPPTGGPATMASGLSWDRTWEVFSTLHFTSLSGTVENNTGVFDTSDSNLNFSAGIEKYFNVSNSFLRNLSLQLLLNISSAKTSIETNAISSTQTSYGLGASWHFMNEALSYGRVTPYLNISLGVGSTSSELESFDSQTGTVVATEPQDGDLNFFSFGVGAKYYLPFGLGARAQLDYFVLSEEVPFEDGTSITRDVAGPLFKLGLSYRF